jgi:hypothetical protein
VWDILFLRSDIAALCCSQRSLQASSALFAFCDPPRQITGGVGCRFIGPAPLSDPSHVDAKAESGSSSDQKQK